MTATVTVRIANAKAAPISDGFEGDEIQALTDFVIVVTDGPHLKSIFSSTFRFPTNTKILVKYKGLKNIPRDSYPFYQINIRKPFSSWEACETKY